MNEFKSSTLKMIDSLKAICANFGLGNTGNEYKIITETFLYKFLNDKFLYELGKLPKFKGKTTAEIEKILAAISDYDFELAMIDIFQSAIIKPKDLISSLFRQQHKRDFHKTFDAALSSISNTNQLIFSVKAGEGTAIKLFEPISNYVVQTERRDDFCRAIINKLVDVNFGEIFHQSYDFFAEIFEYLIKDYNKDFGKYAEYYTPHSIAGIIAKILVTEKVHAVKIYDPSAGSGTLILALAHQIGENKCSLYAQDISQKSNELLRLNLILNNLIHSLVNVIQDDTLLNPRHLNHRKTALKTFDFIVSNPPFKMDFSETRETLAGDSYRARFFAGVPNVPNKKKDSMSIYLLFIQHIIKSMNNRCKAAVVVPTGFLTAASGIELRIRKFIVEHKILRGVISMPSNIFANTGTNVSIVFLEKNISDDKVLLLDASNFGTKLKVEGNKNQRTYLSKNEIDSIIEIFNQRRVVDDVSASVTFGDIAKKNFSFSAGQFFQVKIEHLDISHDDFQNKLQTFYADLKNFFQHSRLLENQILSQPESFNYEKM